MGRLTLLGVGQQNLANFIIATGGTIIDVGNMRVHIFESTDDFDITYAGLPPYNKLTVLVVAGGGGGGASGAGGGGVIYEENITATIGVHTASIGAGGSGSIGASTPGSQGSDSSFMGYTAIGGGGGATLNGGEGGVIRAGGDGGSGGGSVAGSTKPQGAGTVGQGGDSGDFIS